MKTIVIPYKRSYTNELIYCLRSLKNYKHKNLVIIGDRPEDIDLEKLTYIPFRQSNNIAGNVVNILRAACESQEVTDDFVWWHDDMYILRRRSKLPIHHRGTYDEVVENYKTRFSSYYIRRMKITNKHLKSLGIEKPLCYELHIPFIFNKQKHSRT